MKVVEGAGHALLQEAGIDVNHIFDEMGFYTTSEHSPKPVKRVMAKRGKEATNGNEGSGLGEGREIMLSVDNAKSIELPTLGSSPRCATTSA